MEKLGFEHYGFQTVFGFTDSIFIKHHGTASYAAPANTQQQILQNNLLFNFLKIVSIN
jgi:hypothetical protein